MSSIADDIRNSFRKKNNAVVQIVLLNIFVFAGLFIFRGLLSISTTTTPIAELLGEQFRLSAPIFEFIRRPWTLLTYCFMHQDVFHLLFNMIAFFWFGTLIEDLIGSRKLISIYVLGGVVSGLIYIAIYNALSFAPNSLSVRNVATDLVGSSAAVYAVMFATITLVPEYEFYFFRLFLVKIKYVAWAFLLISFLNPSTGVSHAGGAALGYLYIKLLRMGFDLGSPFEAIQDWFKGFGKSTNQENKLPTDRKRFTKTTVFTNTSTNTTFSETSFYPEQDEVDAILDKISKSGYESLSKDEKHTLYRASQKND
jgi:membrane associated rhomboid family serine protease